MKHLLNASVLICLFNQTVVADELTYEDLLSAESEYLQAEQSDSSLDEPLPAGEADSEEPLELVYVDQYERSLFSVGEVDVERKITLNGGGKTLRADAFELGFHIAVNYTP
jgi:hypothetical protein